jgi:enoyl-CoA hydratase/carnithine racemase
MDEIKYIVLKGAGGNFTSGNDLKNFMNPLLS